MPAFPSYGQLKLDGFGETPRTAVVRTSMEKGPPKQRKVASRVMVERAITLVYSASDYASFKTWHRVTVNHGADWFDWVDPVDGATKQARIVNGDVQGKAMADAAGAPLSWEVAMTIETWE